MANQELVQFRVDGDLKREATEIYNKLGLDLPTACRMFLARTKMVRGIPFETTLPERKVTNDEALSAFEELRKQAADVPEMTLDEINDEIASARKSLKAKKAVV
ncbi:MAG: type II toxin-antitoxin system RelB/DinJ family antitoxin [Lachnospiraceae bacterium]|nr:type II toxin-antitoxin system RelB/DinJ family antitoxin [Lachnospiraceae bacterium]